MEHAVAVAADGTALAMYSVRGGGSGLDDQLYARRFVPATGWGPATLVHALPLVVPRERLGAVESAIVRLNHALALPGFGLDHESRRLYFREVLPITAEGVSPTDVQALFRAMVRTSLDLLGPIQRIIDGSGSPESVVVDASIELTLGDPGGPVL